MSQQRPTRCELDCQDHPDSRIMVVTTEGRLGTEAGQVIEPGELGGARRAWSTLRLAVSGSDEDLTRGPIGRAVFLLAVPMVLEMLMESIFAVCDVFFVARLGVDAVAAVGLTEALICPLYAIAVGLAMATTALVARRIGERRPEAAARAAMQSLWAALAVAAVLAPGGAFAARAMLELMGASDQVVDRGWTFTAVMFGGSATILLLFQINAVFRGAGDAALAMRTLWIANGINIVLDPCLIFGLGPFPELGLVGAAVATTIGRGVGVAYQIWSLANGRHRVTLRRSQLVVVPRVLASLLRVSAGGIAQFLISTASWVALMRIVGTFGSAALAGYTIAIRIIVFTILPAWGIANAAATLMGQNLGAGQPDRAETAVWRAAAYNTGFMAAVAVLFVAGAEPLIRIFSHDPEVIAHGVACLRLISYGYGFYAFGMVVVQAFNGAGDTTTPTVINLFCYWLFQLPLAWLLATRTGLASSGVFIAIMVAESALAVIAVVAFRRGRWRDREV